MNNIIIALAVVIIILILIIGVGRKEPDCYNMILDGYWETSKIFAEESGFTVGRVMINTEANTLFIIMEHEDHISVNELVDYKISNKKLNGSILDADLLILGDISPIPNKFKIKLNLKEGSMIFYNDDLVYLSLYKDSKATAGVV